MAFKEKTQKQLQVGEQIKREVARIFLYDDIFIKNHFKLTVCEADASPDLKRCVIVVEAWAPIRKSNLRLYVRTKTDHNP